jgi:hypothetical protein
LTTNVIFCLDLQNAVFETRVFIASSVGGGHVSFDSLHPGQGPPGACVIKLFSVLSFIIA